MGGGVGQRGGGASRLGSGVGNQSGVEGRGARCLGQEEKSEGIRHPEKQLELTYMFPELFCGMPDSFRLLFLCRLSDDSQNMSDACRKME